MSMTKVNNENAVIILVTGMLIKRAEKTYQELRYFIFDIVGQQASDCFNYFFRR